MRCRRGRDHAVPRRDRAQRQQGRLALRRAAGVDERRAVPDAARPGRAHRRPARRRGRCSRSSSTGSRWSRCARRCARARSPPREAGASHVTAGNYGGNLGPHHIHLRELIAMTLTLTLRAAAGRAARGRGADAPTGSPAQPRGDRGAARAGTATSARALGEFFAVSGAGDDVRVEGDLSRVQLRRRGHDRGAARRSPATSGCTPGPGCAAASCRSRATPATGPAPGCAAARSWCAARRGAGSAAPIPASGRACAAARSSSHGDAGGAGRRRTAARA